MLVCWYFVATLCHQKEEKTKCWDVQNQIEIYPMQRKRAPDSESLTGNPDRKARNLSEILHMETQKYGNPEKT